MNKSMTPTRTFTDFSLFSNEYCLIIQRTKSVLSDALFACAKADWINKKTADEREYWKAGGFVK